MLALVWPAASSAGRCSGSLRPFQTLCRPQVYSEYLPRRRRAWHRNFFDDREMKRRCSARPEGGGGNSPVKQIVGRILVRGTRGRGVAAVLRLRRLRCPSKSPNFTVFSQTSHAVPHSHPSDRTRSTPRKPAAPWAYSRTLCSGGPSRASRSRPRARLGARAQSRIVVFGLAPRH
jgi:hypothetical protein